MIVVDSTVICDFLFGDNSAREASLRLIDVDPEWISHSLILCEVGNVSLKYMRHAKWSREDAEAQLAKVPDLLVELVAAVNSQGVFDIAAVTGLSFYDASYVWLARARGLKLRTRDKEILMKCPDVAEGMG